MTIYFVMTFLILIVGLITNPSKKKNSRALFLMFCFAVLVFVSGFRDVSVGVDTRSYLSLFTNVELINIYNSRFEPGFLFLLKAIHTISSSEVFFLLSTSCITIGIPIIIVYKYSKDPLLSVILYILIKEYFYQMNLIRQSLADVIILAALSMLIGNKQRKTNVFSFILILLGVSIHKASSIAFVPYAIFVSPKRREKYLKPETIVRYTIVASVIAFTAFPLVKVVLLYLFPEYSMYFYSEWGGIKLLCVFDNNAYVSCFPDSRS